MLTRILLAAYGLVGLANVIGEASGSGAVVAVTKPLLMPLLLGWLIAYSRQVHLRDPALSWLGIGLVFAWFGDLLLMGDGDLLFMGGIGAFLLMQVCYLVAFTRVPGPGLVRAWKIAALPYLLLWIVLNVVVGSGVGALRIPVIIYSAVLVTMAIAALDLVLRVPRPLGWRVMSGALLFVLSDALIAMTAFGPLDSSNAMDVVIMTTYIAAQAMIATGLAGSVAANKRAAATR